MNIVETIPTHPSSTSLLPGKVLWRLNKLLAVAALQHLQIIRLWKWSTPVPVNVQLSLWTYSFPCECTAVPVNVQLHSFLSSASDRTSVVHFMAWLLYPGKRCLSTYCPGSWVSPRASLLLLLGTEPRFLGCPVCSLVTTPNTRFQLRN